MRRNDIVIAAARGAYTSKPRPHVVVQADAFADTGSVIIVPVTSLAAEAAILRVPVTVLAGTGLRAASWMMMDKVSSVPRAAVNRQIGRLAPEDVTRLNRALLLILGIA